eukprot:3723967-Alexandrium_andersonii.AAC.1
MRSPSQDKPRRRVRLALARTGLDPEALQVRRAHLSGCPRRQQCTATSSPTPGRWRAPARRPGPAG